MTRRPRCELIRKLHAMLGSPSDKEALSARKKLSRLMAEQELSWNDLPAILAGSRTIDRS
jgi:hypothetical protein